MFPINYEEIESHPERVSNIEAFLNKYNWEGINYPSKIDDWKIFEKNNWTIALNMSLSLFQYVIVIVIIQVNREAQHIVFVV